MARLQEEVRSAFSRYEEIDSASTIPLKYLKAVAQEAMRIYPPLPFALPRVVPEPGCHVDGQFLPGGVRISLFSPLHVSSSMVFFPTDRVCMLSILLQTVVSTSTFAASMSSANFDRPWEFIPERWLEKSESTDALEASQPFSYGSRACLGRRYVYSTVVAIVVF